MHIETILTAIDEQVGVNIRTARKAIGMTQTELGAAIGVSFQQVQKYERGINRVSSSALVVIARALKVSTQALLGSAEAEDVASPDMELTRQFMLSPYGREIASSLLKLNGRQAALVAELAAAMEPVPPPPAAGARLAVAA